MSSGNAYVKSASYLPRKASVFIENNKIDAAVRMTGIEIFHNNYWSRQWYFSINIKGNVDISLEIGAYAPYERNNIRLYVFLEK